MRKNPFKGHRFPPKIILWAVRWYYRYAISYRELQDMLEESGVFVNSATLCRWVQKFGPEVAKRAFKHRSWRGLDWYVDETYIRIKGRLYYLWRAVDQRGQLIDFRLTAKRDAKAARAFLKQARDNARLYQPMTITTDKARAYRKVLEEVNHGELEADRIRHISRKYQNNRIESDHAALKKYLYPMRGFQSLRTAKATLKGIETIRNIKRGHVYGKMQGVNGEVDFLHQLFDING